MKPNEPFAQVVHATQVLVEAPFQRPLAPLPSPDHPTREGHLSWMLLHALHLRERGNTEQAYLWLGFVQGVLIMRGMDLAELDLANRDEARVGSYLSKE